MKLFFLELVYSYYTCYTDFDKKYVGWEVSRLFRGVGMGILVVVIRGAVGGTFFFEKIALGVKIAARKC